MTPQRFLPRIWLALAALAVLPGGRAAADPAPFDLAGPTLTVTVQRGAATLPMTQVPNLRPGDQLLIQPELPASQSVHYLMVAAFLRGPTNPPPDDWFFRCNTWAKPCHEAGLRLTVPADAEQLLVFFAPETGGDFKTLRSAVQGRPGAFVRAAQQLNQAALDRSRLDRFLAALREVDARDPAKVKDAAPLLARSLAIKVDDKCLSRMPALQAACLMQGQESLILSDGHSRSMVATLTTGPASDLAMQAGSTSMMNSGAYLPYIGSILDIARLMDTFHTAQYQYIPALTSQRGERVALMLNTPPSFHDPKSVLVAALPAVEAPQPPPLRNVDAKSALCVQKRPLVLPVEGAPLVFATDYAHGLTLETVARDGSHVSLPLHADPALGGLVVDPAAGAMPDVDEGRGATVHGVWGFDRFEGPSFGLANPRSRAWTLAPGDESALVLGREDTVHLVSGNALCLEDVRIRESDGTEDKVAWTVVKPDRIEVKVGLSGARPGERVIEVHQYGQPQPQQLTVRAYVDAGHLEGFVLRAGDPEGVLKGTRLEQVEKLVFRDIEFLPGALASAGGVDELRLSAAAASALRAGEAGTAEVVLKDGRTLKLEVTVAGPRPRGQLVARTVQRVPPVGSLDIRLGSSEEIAADGKFTFAVRAQAPMAYTRDAAIEVAAADGSFATTLDVHHGGLTLANAHVAIATLIPSTAFGPSAFGPLQYRLVLGGVAGDWQALGVLVRLPELRQVACPDDGGRCELSGERLYLLESVADDERFSAAVPVPDSFSAEVITVPRPGDARLFLRLRDDPAAVNVATLPGPAPVPEREADRRATASPR
ncbi:MAG: hypothetical protein JSR54_12390 [Proteobacteria bacterium]|nr:hypothetical protein [Pseudomonadota bacterium]